MNTFEGLVAAVAADPADNLPRLVLADWYEENGQAERAHVIRAACEAAHQLRHLHSAGQPGGCRKCKLSRKVSRWIEGAGKVLFRELFGLPWEWQGIWYGGEELYYDQQRYHAQFDRGVITEVGCPTGVWLGGVCNDCEGHGGYERDQDTYHWAEWVECKACGGRGAIPGAGLRIVAEHPVASFTPTDLPEPIELTNGPQVGYWFWVLRDLPEEIHPHIPNNKVFTVPVVNQDEARRVMSRAFLAWAKAARQQTTPTPGEHGGEQPSLTRGAQHGDESPRPGR